MRDDLGSRRLLAAGTVLLALAGLPAAASAQDACSNAALGGVGPDCRAPEQVTPTDKAGRSILEGEPVFAATTGSRVTFRSFGAFAGNESAPFRSSLQGRRDAAGWSVRGVDPLLVDVGLLPAAATLAVSDDGSKSLVASAARLTPDAPQAGSHLYLRDLDDLTRFTRIASVPGVLAEGSLVIDGTPDFSTVSIRSLVPLIPDGEEMFGPIRLYRWSAATGVLERVDRTNGFDVDDPNDPSDSTGFGEPPFYDESARTVSADGTRLTYERITGDSPETFNSELRQYVGGERRLVSHPAGQPDTPANGTSPIASPDGRAVTFVSGDPLTAASPALGQSVYRWTDDGTVVDLLVGQDGLDVLSGLTVEAVSPDGELVWFRSSSSVQFGNNPNGGLYALDTTTGTLVQSISLDAAFDSVIRFSPNGRVVAFTSPGDTFNQPTPPTCGDDRECAVQVFTTGAGTSPTTLRCLTCTGTPAGSVSLDKASFPQRSTAVLDDGRVFFDARARLTPQDENAELDVYQYTPDPSRNVLGTISLLSSGRGPFPALFGGASADGQDVYIVTQAQLVPADADDRTDVYSARAGGGLAAQQVRPAPVEPCRGDACKPPATPVPATPAPVNLGSNEPPPPAPPSPPAFSVSTFSAAELRSAVRNGTLRVRVRVGAAGTVSAGLRGRVRGSSRALGSRTVRVAEAGTVTLRLRLSRAARNRLRRTGTLSARLTVAYSERTNRVRRTIVLRGGRR